jgi:hypothetical protein
MFEISQAAVNDAGGTASHAGGEVILLNQESAFAGTCTFASDCDPVDAAPDDHHVKVLAFERRSGFEG